MGTASDAVKCTFRGIGGALLNNYRIGPLVYVTELLLPELPSASLTQAVPPVSVRVGETPSGLNAPLARERSFEANDTEFLLRLDGVATYYAHDGIEVVIAPEQGAPELDVRSYLMGSLFAVLCHQRELLPLHASAVATEDGAIAFLGSSGAGKSSLAAFLARGGYRVLADDICVVDPGAPKDRRVLPVAPWLKLWSATLEAMGEPSGGLARVFSNDEKYRYTLDEQQTETGLRELIVLERSEADGEVSFDRLTPAQAMQAVLDFTYQGWLVRAIHRTEEYFLRCGKALEGVRVTRMRRPWGFDAMETNLSALEAHLASSE
jgi:hypothetical protein